MKNITIPCCIAVLSLFLLATCKKDIVGPSKTKPEVKIISPANNAIILESDTIKIDVLSENAIQKIEIYIDAMLDSSKTLTTKPYTAFWKFPSEPDSTVHTLQAKAIDVNGNQILSPTITVINRRFSPHTLEITSTSEDSIMLRWKNISDVNLEYTIEQSIQDSAFAVRDTIHENKTTATIGGPFTANINYSFRVRAFSNAKESQYSNIATTAIIFNSPAINSIHASTDSSIEIAWRDTSTIKEHFEIEKSLDGTTFTVVKTVNIISPNQFDFSTTLIDTYNVGQQYYFRIKTKSIYNSSPYSTVVSTTVPFFAPNGLKIVSSSDQYLELSWGTVSRFTEQIIVERQTNNQGFIEIARLNNDLQTYKDSLIDIKNTYEYRIKSVNGNYSSNYSNIVSAQYITTGNFELHKTLAGHSTEVGDVAFVNYDQYAVSSGNDHSIRVWDVKTGSMISTFTSTPSGFGAPPAMATTNIWIAFQEGRSQIKIVDAISGNLIKTLTSSDANLITGLAFSPDGQYLAAVHTGSLVVWKVSDWSVLYYKTSGDHLYSVSFSPDSKLIATGSTLSGKGSIIDAAKGTDIRWLDNHNYAPVKAIAFNPKNNEIAMDGGGTTVGIFNVSDGVLLKTLNTKSNKIEAISYHPNGTDIAVGFDLAQDSLEFYGAQIWENNVPVQSILQNIHIMGISFSNDGRYLITGNFLGGVTLYYRNGLWQIKN